MHLNCITVLNMLFMAAIDLRTQLGSYRRKKMEDPPGHEKWELQSLKALRTSFEPAGQSL